MSDWSAPLLSWEGDIQALVTEANRVLGTFEPPVEPVTLSLVRHYQTRGLVGRGVRRGRQAFFGIDDLRAVIETKRLAADGWGLEKVSRIYQATHSTMTSALPAVGSASLNGWEGVAYTAGPQDVPSPLPSFTMGLGSSDDPLPQETRAVEVIQTLMRQSATTGQSDTMAPSLSLPGVTSSSLTGAAARGGVSVGRVAASPKSAPPPEAPVLNYAALAGAAMSTSTLKEEVQAAPWLTGYLDVRRLQALTPEEVDAALDTLRARIASHRPPPKR